MRCKVQRVSTIRPVFREQSVWVNSRFMKSWTKSTNLVCIFCYHAHGDVSTHWTIAMRFQFANNHAYQFPSRINRLEQKFADGGEILCFLVWIILDVLLFVQLFGRYGFTKWFGASQIRSTCFLRLFWGSQRSAHMKDKLGPMTSVDRNKKERASP
ncbi:hypothetical protein KCU85_g451, partial [Aureobasidium melanogenum]